MLFDLVLEPVQRFAAKARRFAADGARAIVRALDRLVGGFAQPLGGVGQGFADVFAGAVGGVGGALARHRVQTTDAGFEIADQLADLAFDLCNVVGHSAFTGHDTDSSAPRGEAAKLRFNAWLPAGFHCGSMAPNATGAADRSWLRPITPAEHEGRGESRPVGTTIRGRPIQASEQD